MRRRKKVFGPGRAVPLDKNAKARITACVKAWSARHPSAPSWRSWRPCYGASASRSGTCYPPYKRVAERAGCARSTVAEAIKVLETAGVLSSIQNKCTDLFGKSGRRWRVVRTSNAYCFHDPKAATQAGIPSHSHFRSGLNRDSSVASGAALPTISTAPSALTSRGAALQQALNRLAAAIAAKEGIEQEGVTA